MKYRSMNGDERPSPDQASIDDRGGHPEIPRSGVIQCFICHAPAKDCRHAPNYGREAVPEWVRRARLGALVGKDLTGAAA